MDQIELSSIKNNKINLKSNKIHHPDLKKLNFQDSEIPKNESMFKDPGAFVYYDKDINRKKWDSEESEKNN